MADAEVKTTPEGGQAADTKPDAGAGADNAGENGTGDAGTQKTFTQEEVNKIIDQRLKRHEKILDEKHAEEAKKAAMSEADRLKSEVDAANLKATKAEEAANKRAVNAEAKVILSSLGVKREQLGYALKMLDLAEVTVDDSGEPDTKAIGDAVKAMLAAIPALASADGAAKGGTDFSGTGKPGDPPLTDDLIGSMSPEETARRMPEIRAFYESRRK